MVSVISNGRPDTGDCLYQNIDALLFNEFADKKNGFPMGTRRGGTVSCDKIRQQGNIMNTKFLFVQSMREPKA
jgi:hypothetical protein